MNLVELKKTISSAGKDEFEKLALDVFRFQSENCSVYRAFLNHLQSDIANIINVSDIPFLPIAFFKNFEVLSTDLPIEKIFESSSTGGMGVSKHFVNDINWYRDSLIRSFDFKFGSFTEFCHLALLPSYLEREGSSLIFQVDHFIKNSRYPQSAFYLNNLSDLQKQLIENEKNNIPTILWGVTYALLDFAESFPMELKNTTILETGGMKGRRKEITRMELHDILKTSFNTKRVGGEYGMTELMSQAYSESDGIYVCPPQMRVSIREINDPLSKPIVGRHGAVNVIDLANVHSCSFIATSDLGKVYDDGSFEILGRIDHSDTRGCNLLVS